MTRFAVLMTVLFIGLKLTGVIDWSWWYVTLPIYALPLLGGIILILLFAVGVIAKAINKIT